MTMNILAFNGSPRKNWNTATLLKSALEGARSRGAETELVHLYDFDFNLNYLFANITEFPLAPYAGVGFTGGLTAATAKGYDSESRIEVLARVNFGLEFKFWQSASKRSFLTVASVNSYDFVASGDRPRHLYMGGALKYYFRP